ncbi:hypothetical protein PRK78_006892 [Emydomyces testavorans]|uniref:Sodium/calcium exchanger membrane region domain-containing protein n=1 Tax=Emydomyces testavorans TaxID=2070801 RepID=A0AAF0DP99_9EURO|nr:hypothetical protein PRK78_006892 [Emydomyces testavorans]
MANADIVAYNIAVFIATLFVLEFGADKFIHHTAIVARRTGISETLIGLLTAGGEWEELAVVAASLAQGRSSLAIGNVVGSAISNILGAFSLGLLFYEKGKPVQFDHSSRVYSILALVVTTFFAPAAYFHTRAVWLGCGSILLASFVFYIISVAIGIRRGHLTAPEDSDSDSSDDDQVDVNSRVGDAERQSSSSDADLIQDRPEEARCRGRGLAYHIFYLFVGFLATCLAGYILSHAAITITDEFGLSNILFGVIILAIATTLPEKFIAVISGHRGHGGILVANTAGSNIFLLTLCAGIIFVDAKDVDKGDVTVPELAVLWASTLAFTLTVWFGERFARWIGALMVLLYIVFIVLDVLVIHSVV